jgi:hypothetical protein
LEKQEPETAPTSKPLDLAADVQHVTTTTTNTATIPAPINTATPTIYETTTTTATTADDSNSAVTRIEQQYNKEPEVRREREWRRRTERANERPSGER